MAEQKHRPLQVGDIVRLTGTEWADYHAFGGRGAEVQITKIIPSDPYYEAKFGDGWYTTSRPLKDDKYAEEVYDQWGCELVTPVEDIESGDEDLIEARIGNVSVMANSTKEGKIIVRAHRGNHVITALLDDEQLDELTTVLLYIKMERDKLKE